MRVNIKLAIAAVMLAAGFGSAAATSALASAPAGQVHIMAHGQIAAGDGPGNTQWS